MAPGSGPPDAGLEGLLPPRRRRRMPRPRVDLRIAGRRLAASLPAIAQMILAAVAAYAVAHWGLGHVYPVLSVTVAVSSLGFQQDARPRRVAETAIGMVLGILIAELIYLAWGGGILQIALALVVVLVLGRLLSPSPAFAVAAAVQTAFVLVLPPPEGGPFLRPIDALVGGGMALLFTALLPRDPRRAAARAGRGILAEVADSLSSLAAALELGDVRPARHALAAMRRTQPLIESWSASLESAVAVARISPIMRRHLPRLRSQERLEYYVDLAARNLRVVARRIAFTIEEDDRPRPELGDLLARTKAGVDLLARSLTDETAADPARRFFTELADWLTPELPGPGGGVADLGLVLSIRPMIVDLLCATGLEPEQARAVLPPLRD